MKVLHLFSNSKWTGPAEPALNLCLALRSEGVETAFACAPHAASGRNKIVETARERGLEPIQALHLSKHSHPVRNFFDRRGLRRLLLEHRFDLVHCHLSNDHAIAARPAAEMGVPVVRSNYEGEGITHVRRAQRLMPHTAFLIEPSRLALEHDATRLLYPRDRMAVVPGAVDAHRFDPARALPDGRALLGLPPEAFVIGIVARMQTHRHFADFFHAIRRLADAQPGVHAVVVGRGTHQATVGMQPVRDLNLEDRVHFPGFLDGDDYVGMLAAFDVKVFLVPGSDGTCRAVREALAMGKPAVVARRGMLDEIVDDGETGYVVDGSPEALADALGRLAADRALCQRMGEAARRVAETCYSLEAQAQAVAAIYERVLARPQATPDSG